METNHFLFSNRQKSADLNAMHIVYYLSKTNPQFSWKISNASDKAFFKPSKTTEHWLPMPNKKQKALPILSSLLPDKQEHLPCRVRPLMLIADQLSTNSINKTTTHRNLVVFPTDNVRLTTLLVRLVSLMCFLTTGPVDLSAVRLDLIQLSMKTLPIRIVALPIT